LFGDDDGAACDSRIYARLDLCGAGFKIDHGD